MRQDGDGDFRGKKNQEASSPQGAMCLLVKKWYQDAGRGQKHTFTLPCPSLKGRVPPYPPARRYVVSGRRHLPL